MKHTSDFLRKRPEVGAEEEVWEEGAGKHLSPTEKEVVVRQQLEAVKRQVRL